MLGKLIFVSGLKGSGKTTLVQKALESVDNLDVHLTYTTRPQRDEEQDSYEYVFSVTINMHRTPTNILKT